MGFFPGFFTLLASSLAVYVLWTSWLVAYAAWISLPVAILTFLLCWLAFGKISLLPVEDFIIDETQHLAFGEVRVPGAPWSFWRVLREMVFGFGVAIAGVFIFVIGFVPVFAVIALVGASWISAYGFLSPVYDRRVGTLKGKISLFLADALPNFFLGFFLNVLLFIPGLNVLLLGYALVLSTLLALRHIPASTDRT